jgi:hypothetical protein
VTTAYVESSAAAKLVLREPDSDTLRLSLRSHDHLVSSDLTRLEVTRAAWRAAGDTGLAQERAALLPIDTIPIERADTVGIPAYPSSGGGRPSAVMKCLCTPSPSSRWLCLCL